MNPMFWQHLPTSVEVVMLLVASGVFVKWVVDDFRHSRVSAITWLFVVSSVLGFILAANSALQLSRQRRDLILLQIGHYPKTSALYEAAAANTIVDELLSRDFRRLRRENGFQEGIHGE
jgi:hypothetical protein